MKDGINHRTTGRCNLLFIMTDHQRADSLGMSAAGIEVTPNLNRLASESAVFHRAYTSAPLCVPARTALATGLYPTATGVTYNDWAGDTAGDFTPIHQILAQAGYETAHIGVDHVKLKPSYKERGGFSLWCDFADHRRYLEESGRELTDQKPYKSTVNEFIEGLGLQERTYSNTRVGVWPHPPEYFGDSFFCRCAADFIRRPRRNPFALFLYLWAPHPPLELPEPYASMFDPEAIELPDNVGVPAEGEPPSYARSAARQLSQGISRDEWRKVWAAHLGLVRLADEGIGRVLAALHETGPDTNTVTVFTVDHGDNLGQHRMYQKMEMYEEAVRIPLLIGGPGIASRSCNTPVSHLDVLPTLIDLLKLPGTIPGGHPATPAPGPRNAAGTVATDAISGSGLPHGNTSSDGRSLAAYLRGDSELDEKPVFIQYSGNPRIGDLRRAVVDGNLKYVHDGLGGEELFDLVSDPAETTNRIGDPAYAAARNRLRSLCAGWAHSHKDKVLPPE